MRSSRDRWTVEAHQKGYRVTDSGEVISPSGVSRKLTCHEGYLRFNVRVEGVAVPVAVHKLAAYQVFGEDSMRPDVQIRHRNGVRTDNRPSNFLLGSNLDNIMDRTPADRKEHAKKAAAALRSFTEEQAKQLLEDRRSGMTFRDLGLKYGVSVSTAHGVVSGRFYEELQR
jgi:hypothetical protein